MSMISKDIIYGSFTTQTLPLLKIRDLIISPAFMIICREKLPQEGLTHLLELTKSVHAKDSPHLIIKSREGDAGQTNFDIYADLKPIPPPPHTLSTTAEMTPFDLKIDEQIRNTFVSDQCANTLFTYTFEHQPYRIRVIHNPNTCSR